MSGEVTSNVREGTADQSTGKFAEGSENCNLWRLLLLASAKTYLNSSIEGAVDVGEEPGAGNLSPTKLFQQPVPTEGPSGETYTETPYTGS